MYVVLFFSIFLAISLGRNLKYIDHYYFQTNRDLPQFLETADRVELIMQEHPDSFVFLDFLTRIQKIVLKIGSSDETATKMNTKEINIDK